MIYALRMRRSDHRILTTHVGSLPRPADFDAARLPEAVAAIVRKQADTGIDIVNDGEFSKSSWSAYFSERLANIDVRPGTRSMPGYIWQRDEHLFPEWFAGERRTGGPRYSHVLRARQGPPAPQSGSWCVGPLAYIGAAQVQADIVNLKAAAAGHAVSELCLTALAPTIMAYFLADAHYGDEEKFLFAIAEAMNAEYRAITDAGLLLQIDEPALATNWHFLTGMDVPAYGR